MTTPDKALVCPDVLRVASSGPVLYGNRCTSCGEVFFPTHIGCTCCGGAELEAYDLGDRGELWSWTIQGFEPKTPYDGKSGADFRPFGVGYVQMPSGIKVESRLLAKDFTAVRIGMPVQLVLEAYRKNEAGEPVYTYAFTAEGDAS